MPYFRHPSAWTPERLAEAVSAMQDRQYKFGNRIPPDTSDCECASCKDGNARDRAAYAAFNDRIADLSAGYTDAATAYATLTPGQKVTFAITEQERDAWTYRQRARFNTGEYTRVPWHEYEPLGTHRYPHLSVKFPGMVAFTKSDEHGVIDRQTAIKPGRYLKEFFPEWTDDAIRDWVSKCQAITFELKIATTAADIVRVYCGGPESCMSHPISTYQSSVHPVSAYGDSDLAIAYYGDINAASARAIIWPEKKRYGRIYGGVHTLQQLLIQNGYTSGSMAGACIRCIPDNGGYVLPYVDGISYAKVERRKVDRRNGQRVIRLGNGNLDCTTTCGVSNGDDDDDHDDDNYWTCDHCDERQSDDDTRYDHRPRGRRYTQTICETCYADCQNAPIDAIVTETEVSPF